MQIPQGLWTELWLPFSTGKCRVVYTMHRYFGGNIYQHLHERVTQTLLNSLNRRLSKHSSHCSQSSELSCKSICSCNINTCVCAVPTSSLLMHVLLSLNLSFGKLSLIPTGLHALGRKASSNQSFGDYFIFSALGTQQQSPVLYKEEVLRAVLDKALSSCQFQPSLLMLI